MQNNEVSKGLRDGFALSTISNATKCEYNFYRQNPAYFSRIQFK